MPSEVALVLEKALVARHEALAAPKKVTGGVKGVEMKGAVTKAKKHAGDLKALAEAQQGSGMYFAGGKGLW